MGRRYTVIPIDAFDALQFDAGVFLKHFDIEAATSSVDNPGFTDEDLVCATTGGIKPTCKPTYSDLGEDVDNVAPNMMEFKHLDGWDCKMATTGLGTSPELIRMSLGAADIVDGTKIVPRQTLATSDFSDLWWVGDKANGGFVAIQLKNALSTGGFELQTSKNGKGQLNIEITGHVSRKTQSEVPMVFYSIDPDDAVVEPDIYLSRGNVSIEEGATATITATTVPTGQSVTWSTSDDTVATVANGVITAVAAGTATITATMTYSGQTYTDTCNITVTATGA